MTGVENTELEMIRKEGNSTDIISGATLNPASIFSAK
jgi:Na+-translocating ferredoxin:NAD+ oxidoreductase RnfG subunit